MLTTLEGDRLDSLNTNFQGSDQERDPVTLSGWRSRVTRAVKRTYRRGRVTVKRKVATAAQKASIAAYKRAVLLKYKAVQLAKVKAAKVRALALKKVQVAKEKARALTLQKANILRMAKIALQQSPAYKEYAAYKEQLKKNLAVVNQFKNVRSVNDLKMVGKQALVNALKTTPTYQKAMLYKTYAKDMAKLKNIKSKEDLQKLAVEMAKSYGKEYIKSTDTYKQYKAKREQLKKTVLNNPYVIQARALSKSIQENIDNANRALEEGNKELLEKLDINVEEMSKLQRQGVLKETEPGKLSVQVITPEIDYRKGRLF